MQASRLLHLPAEIRNKIYSYTLVNPEPIPLASHDIPKTRTDQYTTLSYPNEREPPFLRTCKQIRHETLPIFYGQNTFFSATRDALAVWLKAIGPDKTQLIRSVRGFSPSRYFNYCRAVKFITSIEGYLKAQGCGLGKGVFAVPFAVDGEEPRIFWMSERAEMVLVGREGETSDEGSVRSVFVDDEGKVRLEE